MDMKRLNNYINQERYTLTEKYYTDSNLIDIGFKKIGTRFVMRKPLYNDAVYVKFVVESFNDDKSFTYYIIKSNGDLYSTYYSEYSSNDRINKIIRKKLNNEINTLLDKRVIIENANNSSIKIETSVIKVKRVNKYGKLPTYGSNQAAGADLYSTEKIPCIKPNETVFIYTGIAMEIPEGYVGLIYARSGLACKDDLAPANKVGVIDSDYRGEIIVALHNHGKENRSVNINDRIAQIIFQPVQQFDFIEINTLNNTDRGSGGFGSTGAQ